MLSGNVSVKVYIISHSKEHTMDLNQVFENHSDKEDIYPLTVREIA